MKPSQGQRALEARARSKRPSRIDGAGPQMESKTTSRTGRAPGESRQRGPAQNSARRSAPASRWLFVGLLLFVIMPFLFWRMTWFGGRLSDQEMGQYLRDTSVPHKTQHALSQLAEQIARGDPGARQWYPQLLVLAAAGEPQFRMMAAWGMGQDNKSREFQQALLKLLHDPVPMVRWNAALALVRFGDSTGEPQIKFMLRPYSLRAPQAGTVDFNLRENDEVRAGSLVARIKTGKSGAVELRSPLAGAIQRELKQGGVAVQAGEEVAVLSPGEDQVWEALRALYVVGRPADLEDVNRFAHQASGMPERVRMQAQLAEEAIRKRSGD